MQTLHVRSVPDELYERLQRLAQTRSRSISAQVVTMLYQALDEEELRKDQTRVLDSIRRRRFIPTRKTPASLEILRDDRRR